RPVARQSRIAVELGREHFDAGARGANAELDVRAAQRLEQPRGIRRARGAGYAEKDAHYFGPLEAKRNVAIWWTVVLPSEPNFGITVFPNLDGSVMYDCNVATFFFVPSALRSGAPRLPPPVPRYVWHAVQPETANAFAPATA